MIDESKYRSQALESWDQQREQAMEEWAHKLRTMMNKSHRLLNIWQHVFRHKIYSSKKRA